MTASNKCPTALARRLAAAAAALLALMIFIPMSAFAAAPSVITDRESFIRAVSQAKDGDTIYVGDIDFSVTGVEGAYNRLERISIERGITVAAANGEAVFTRAAFNLEGVENDGRRLNVRFENIRFEGGADTAALTDSDWLIDPEVDQYESVNSRYAISFHGNTDAAFVGCSFSGYMHEGGGAMWGQYMEKGMCRLNIELESCVFSANASRGAGGAIYLDGSGRNITLTARDCRFEKNLSGFSDLALLGGGGGAIFAQNADLTLLDCEFEGNVANHIYDGGEMPAADSTNGGAIFAQDCGLTMTRCTVSGNRAGRGGGLYLGICDTLINGCEITSNRADPAVFNEAFSGPWANTGLAGAVYIFSETGTKTEFINTIITGNASSNCYGGVFQMQLPEPIGCGDIYFLMCDYTDNVAEREFTYPGNFPGYDVPDDVWSYPAFHALGSLITDDTFAADFPRGEAPTADNGYNLFAAPADYAGERPALPTDFVEQTLGERFDGYFGSFHVGSNCVKTASVSLDGKAETLNYARSVSSDAPSRLGLTFDGYRTEDGRRFDCEKPLIACELKLTSAWKLNALGIVLYIVLPALIILTLALSLLMHRGRKRMRPAAAAVATADAARDAAPAPVGEADTERIIAASPEAATLTPRELQVLRLMLKGKKHRETAEELYVSEITVKKEAASVYAKFGVKNRVELLAKMNGR